MESDHVVNNEIDYKVRSYSYPKYKFSRVLPLSGSTTLAVGATSQQEVQFELPKKVFNLSKSLLEYNHPRSCCESSKLDVC